MLMKGVSDVSAPAPPPSWLSQGLHTFAHTPIIISTVGEGKFAKCPLERDTEGILRRAPGACASSTGHEIP